MKQITYKRISNIVKYFLYLTVLYVITFSCVSCESKSGQLTIIKPEKVVIIDSTPREYKWTTQTHMYYYKVQRIEHRVVDYIYDMRLLEKGDTIYKRFQ